MSRVHLRRSKPHGLIISLSGIDGSGKSSTASRLLEELRGMGYEASSVWMRWDPKWAKPFVDSFRRAAYPSAAASGIPSNERRLLLRNPLVRLTWLAIMSADYTLQVFFSVTRRLRAGVIVICDRYIFDSAVYLSLDLSLPPERAYEVLGKFPFNALPKPDLWFLLDIPVEVALSRKTDITDENNLEFYRHAYLGLAKAFGGITLDATGHPDAILSEISTRVAKQLRHGERD